MIHPDVDVEHHARLKMIESKGRGVVTLCHQYVMDLLRREGPPPRLLATRPTVTGSILCFVNIGYVVTRTEQKQLSCDNAPRHMEHIGRSHAMQACKYPHVL